eukprot:CAMPEP_0185573030 /NCGR_PEP_ID=MMETSP0434-20130131/4848_1 /TAXON_ID=626734 ORGANISM="Favella taraikaensis, Strain Fe Narragansett Bay" /NCGR_SAMPLE_ID=MMETSP0434 /ASSEMBLY_ACC=CAM_ASM_000379 /LENGTH=47 /DNA_ID= /DNA_START= /DNA_END= /DNA_ORIENTATION=
MIDPKLQDSSTKDSDPPQLASPMLEDSLRVEASIGEETTARRQRRGD